MPNRSEMQKADAPEMHGPQQSRESEFGAAPKAATTPMRGRRDQEHAGNGHAPQEGAGETDGKPRGEDNTTEHPAPPDAAGKTEQGKADNSGNPEPAPMAREDGKGPAPARPSRPGKAAKPSKPSKPPKSSRGGKHSKRQPMIQRVDPPDFPDFPEPVVDPDKPEGREDSPQMVRAIAVGMPILGLIGGGAFTFGLAALGSVGQFPFSFAVGLIAVLCMMAGVTVIALNLLRQSQKVGKQTDELLSQYFEPETAAVKTVTTLGDAIRREIEKLSGNLDTLTGRISTIEKRLQEQTDELGLAMDRLEQRAKTASQTLSDERDRMENTTRTLNDQTQTAAQSLDEQITAARTVMEQASGGLAEAEKTLGQRISDLGETAKTTVAGADEASGILQKQAERVSEISQSALDAAKRSADRYQNQHRMLTEAIDKLTEEAGRMDRVFDTQRQSLRDIAEAAAKQSERIEEVLGECAKTLGETVDSAGARARSIGSIFAEQSESIQTAGEEAAGAMTRAAESARHHSEDARRTMEEEAQAARRTLEEHLARARETLGGLTDDTAAALEKQLESSRGALDTLLAELRNLVDSRLQQARGLFDTMIGEFDRTIEEQISALREHRDDDRRDWDAWRDRIGTALEGVRLQARDSLKALNETAGEVEERLSALPAKLTGGSEQMRKVLSEQVAAFDNLSASAQKSVASVDALLAGLPDKLSTSSDDLSGRLKAQAKAIEEMTSGARAQMGDLEHMFERLPRRIDGQASHIRTVLDEQMQKIDELAALAARRAQEIAELQKTGALARPVPREKRPPEAEPRRPFRSGPAPAAPEGPATDHRADADQTGKGEHEELSVQEILARRQEAEKAGSPEETGTKADPAARPEERPRERLKPPQAMPPRPAGQETEPVMQRTPAPERPRPEPAGEPKTRPPEAPAEADEAPAEGSDPRKLDHPADFRRLAQMREEQLARQSSESPRTGPDSSEAPSFLRRGPASPEAPRQGAPAGRPRSERPPAERQRAPAGKQPEQPKPIFRKRFANFDEGSAPEARKEETHRPPDDPVTIRKGAENVQRPHPAAARRAMRQDTPDTEESGANEAPPWARRPAAAAPPPKAAEETGPAMLRRPPAEPPEPEQAAEEDVGQEADDSFVDFGPPPIPNALRKAMRRDGAEKGEVQEKPEETSEPEKPSGKPGRLGWSDILAAAERASHEEGIPEAETGLDPDAEKARTAIPEGPTLGTPELQAIGREIVSVLQTLSLDLRPVWRETLPPEVIRRFLKGDKRALTRRLPVMGGMETMTRIRRRYRSETRFRSNVDRFVQEFDVLVDQIHGLDAARAEKYMSSQNGRLFILLKQVLSKS